jgi:molybdopterin molybdotransferase
MMKQAEGMKPRWPRVYFEKEYLGMMLMKSKNGPRDMLGRSRVVSLVEAMDLLRHHMPAAVAEEEMLPLENALDRILSRNIRSSEDLPSHARSTMDGYAVRARDTFGATESMPAYFEISGEVRMGEFPGQGPLPGCCYGIATGGLLPPGTDAVVMLEHTVIVDEQTIEVIKAVAPGAHTIKIGEDIAKGDSLFSVGHRLRPQELGLLAGLGVVALQVYRRVRVGIISTGDELVDFHASPLPGKIRDMNSVHLTALVARTGAQARFYGIVADQQEQLTAMAEKALRENDLVLFSGSSSVGSRDLGEQVIGKLGGPGIIFHGVAVKPGKPVIFALAGNKPVFGLPGHPVSAAVSFNLFVEPVLANLAGRVDNGLPQRKTVAARLLRNISSAAGRTDFVRVRISRDSKGTGYEAQPVLGTSGALSTMVKAHGYIGVGESEQGLKAGDMVEVILYE